MLILPVIGASRRMLRGVKQRHPFILAAIVYNYDQTTNFSSPYFIYYDVLQNTNYLVRPNDCQIIISLNYDVGELDSLIDAKVFVSDSRNKYFHLKIQTERSFIRTNNQVNHFIILY